MLAEKFQQSTRQFVLRRVAEELAEIDAQPKVEPSRAFDLHAFRLELDELYPWELPEDVPRVLLCRAMHARRHMPFLGRVFTAFNRVTLPALRFLDTDHWSNKRDLLCGDFPSQFHSLITDSSEAALLAYSSLHARRLREAGERWLRQGGVPADPAFRTFADLGPEPAELARARRTYHSNQCACSRTQRSRRLFPFSQGYTAEQILRFCPDSVQPPPNYSQLWDIVRDWQLGEFQALRHGRHELPSSDEPLQSYHVTHPFSPVRSLHWVTWSGGVLPARLVAGHPDLRRLLHAHVQQEMENTAVPAIPVFANPEGQLQFMPSHLANYAPEFKWVAEKDDLEQQMLRMALRT